MPRRRIKKAVRIISSAPCIHGRKVRKKRYLNICAPVSDFSPLTPSNIKKRPFYKSNK